MCGPAAPIIAGIGLAFQVYSTVSQANAMAKAEQVTAQNNQKISEYNAQVNEQNAEIQRRAGADALNRGANDASTIRTNWKKANATARASAAGSGLLSDKGTIGKLQDQNVTYGEMNVLTALNNAQREKYAYDIKSTDFLAEARNQRLGGQVGVSNANYRAGVIRNNGMLDATSTLITGGSRMYDKYFWSGK